ncbi:hypothetical protein K8I61_17095 [bacterium]|nr:hypothetical protein [bacterium]
MKNLSAAFANLVSKKLVSTGGAIGTIAWLVSLVAAGTLAAPVALGFAGLIAAVAVTHNIRQGRIDEKKAAAAPPAPPES